MKYKDKLESIKLVEGGKLERPNEERPFYCFSKEDFAFDSIKEIGEDYVVIRSLDDSAIKPEDKEILFTIPLNLLVLKNFNRD